MKRRTIFMFMLSILVLLGLGVGMFTGAIEKALNTPQGKQNMTNTSGMTNTNGMNKTITPNPSPTAKSQNKPDQQANILASDTFQRKDQALWGTASDGNQWDGDANSKPSFSINGSTGKITANEQGTFDAVIGTASKDVDVTISGIVDHFGNKVNLGAVLRWTDTNNWYKAFIDGDHLGIFKTVKGQTTTIARIDVKSSEGIAQTLRFRALGTTLFAKVWQSDTNEPPNWMVVADDQTFTTGQFGIRVLAQSTTVITIMSFKAIIASMGNDA
jgi:hypothetical protein